jgi:GDP-L-fucose synthase
MYIIQDAVNYNGKIVFDKTKPDGTFRKKMDNTRIQNLGYKNTTSLADGIKKTYSWFKNNF